VKAELRRAVALLSLLSALASLLFAGQSYFFCPGMQKAAKGCCCPERPIQEGPAVSRTPCCDRTTLSAPRAPIDLLRHATNVPASSDFEGERIRILDGTIRDFRDRTSDAKTRGARAGPYAELFELHSAYLI
jgi:hypothetical protein